VVLESLLHFSGKYIFGCFDNSDITTKYKVDYVK